MIEKSIKIQLNGGLEARPVAMLVQVASQHESSVYIMSEGRKVNAKSIMGMMSLALDTGESVTVSADGKDEQQAIQSIEEYLSGSKH
ncbi:MAG: HPr family phosphocarrier protein [Lachnospiraceae bacterium]|jgi:catabolite repression HPr-like protein|nr:HPr family phosphocarrier protein [Lachnospiraceae bacterium]MCI9097371.1 HPr family phosphocarrier protein [Lachnospiraceae bacterium]MCI9334482.1 HPr family phosphocarrier protein [Lachnospiraceae bacterium]